MADDWGNDPLVTPDKPKVSATDDWGNDKLITPTSRLMASQLEPTPRWDVVGDIGRAAKSGAEATARSAEAAFTPTGPKQPGESFLGYVGRDIGNEASRFTSALGAPMNALATLSAPVTGAAHALLGSAASYLPFETKQSADRAVDTAMMGLRPAPGAVPSPTSIPTPPTAPLNALSPQAMAQAAGTVPVRPGYAPRVNALSPEGMAAAAAPATAETAENAAVRAIVQRLDQDAKGGGLTPEQIIAERAKTPGTPLSLADLGGENARGLLGNVARAPGEGRQIVKSAIEARDTTAPGRLRQSLNTALGDGTAYEAGTSLMAQRKTAAAPLYEKFEGAAPMTPDAVAPTGVIGRLMDRSSMKQAMKNAIDIAREEGIDAKTLGINVSEAGDPQFVKVPTWRTMDLVKRGIDDVVEANRDPVTGKLTLDNKGRAINGTRAELIQAIDQMNPAYAEARQAWAGPSQSLDVIRFGREALRNEPEANAARLASMSPADQEFARIGLKAELVERMESAGATADEARKLVTNEGMRRKIMPFFPNETVATQFLNDVAAESRIFRTNYDILGNSKTAARTAEDVNGLFDAIGSALHTGVHAMHGNYFAMARGVGNTLRAFGDLRRDPAINAEIARLMFEPLVGGDQPSGSMKLLQNWMSFKNAQAAQQAARATAQQNFMRQYARQAAPPQAPLMTPGAPPQGPGQ